jgi:hypothetical protein
MRLFTARESAKVGAIAAEPGVMAKGINYGQLMHKALRQLMAEVLAQVGRDGLPGKHHFFITFDTTHPGVDMNATLYSPPLKHMTLVIKYSPAGRAVTKDRFSVTLNFGNVPEPIVVPFEAIKTFVDPSVEFGLRFDAHEEEAEAGGSGLEGESPSAPPTPLRSGEAEVVSLDKFRKH